MLRLSWANRDPGIVQIADNTHRCPAAECLEFVSERRFRRRAWCFSRRLHGSSDAGFTLRPIGFLDDLGWNASRNSPGGRAAKTSGFGFAV
jgi:hypothetical protein